MGLSSSALRLREAPGAEAAAGARVSTPPADGIKPRPHEAAAGARLSTPGGGIKPRPRPHDGGAEAGAGDDAVEEDICWMPNHVL